MCSGPRNSYGTPRKFAINLFKPIPADKRIQKFTANMWTRLVKRQLCCGHAGEPGC
jgi:hypothetical protein